jgi:hypothetical protein
MSPQDEVGFFKTILDHAWAVIGVLMGILWNQHKEQIKEIKNEQLDILKAIDVNRLHLDSRLDFFDKDKVSSASFETNRKEVRDVQIKTFDRLEAIGQSLARIEGKLEK